MNEDLWKLLTKNNNCLVNNTIRAKQNSKAIEKIKPQLTKNILGPPENAPEDGEQGGIPGRKCPRNGDEFVNNDTGERFIFQKCQWNLAPSSVQFCPIEGSDLVDVKENGETGVQLVIPPEMDGKFIWCQDGATGRWVDEELFDGNNFIGTGPDDISGSTTIQNGMTRDPINGDEWHNEDNGTSYVFKNDMWVKTACCFQTTPVTGSDYVNTLDNGNTGPDLVTIPTTDGKFIWCQDGDTGMWVDEELYDGNNFIGTGPDDISGFTTIQNGMTRDPINGDEWHNEDNGTSYVFKLGMWVKTNCCFQTTPVTGSDYVNTLENGNTGPNLVTPPATGGKFIWCQDGATGMWVEEELFDGNNFIGTGPDDISGLTTIQNGMTRDPINGDEWHNEDNGTSYVFKGGLWVKTNCCFQTTQETGSDYVNTLENGNTGPNLVTPPATGGKFIWCQNLDGTGAWVDEELFDARNWIGSQTGTINGTTGQLADMTRPPIEGDMYYSGPNLTTYTFQANQWNQHLCCTIVSDSTTSDLLTIIQGDDGGLSFYLAVAPPATGGKFIWCQNSGTASTGAWVEEVCCVEATGLDQTVDDIGELTVDGQTGIEFVQPAATGGKFIWCQNLDGTGAWTPFEGTGTGTEVEANGLDQSLDDVGELIIGGETGIFFVQPPVTGGKFVWCQDKPSPFEDGTGFWVEDECCVEATGLDQTVDDIGELIVDGVTGIEFVQPAATGGKFVWCQNLDGTGAWQPIQTPTTIAFLQGAPLSIQNNDDIIYDAIQEDDNGNYNPTTGEYTASEPGIYLVNFTNTYNYNPNTTGTLMVRNLILLNNGLGPANPFDKVNVIIDTIEEKNFVLHTSGIIRLDNGDTLVNVHEDNIGGTGASGSIELDSDSFISIKKLL